MLPIYPAP